MLAQFPATFSAPPADSVPATARDLPRREGKHALRVLVVDDEPLVRWAITETLQTAGYEVEEADDADTTVRTLLNSAVPPDVVLLDLRLPDCSDLTLLEALRRLVPGASVILMTAFGTPEVRERARSLGAAAILDKPFDVDGLAGFVATLRYKQ